jgi:hypothetical protein
MAALITQVRGLIYDPAGASATFSDDELQAFLDDARTDVNYMPLAARAYVAPSSGAVSYLEWHAPGMGNWEADATTVDGNFGTVTASTVDYRRGVWTYSTSQDNGIYVRGSAYNVYAAAVAALEQWAGRLKFAYDFTADGATFRRSQQIAALQTLIARYEAMAGPQAAVMARDDVL